MAHLECPVTYQGGKQRLAPVLLSAMQVARDEPFDDLCCGTGSVSLALLEAGHQGRVTLLDAGPWGHFWSEVATGKLDLDVLRRYCEAVPKELSRVPDFVREIEVQDPERDTVATFLLLQAAAFGGAAVWIEDGRWRRAGGIRTYWLPTATSNRRSPVNPMMPMPATLLARVRRLCEEIPGRIEAMHTDASEFLADEGVVYIDPPYAGTSGYGKGLEVVPLARRQRTRCFVSEGRPLGDGAVCLSRGVAKGGMNGSRSAAHEEWLTPFGGAVVAGTRPSCEADRGA
jgi:site-specific DNA-adenine methylase